MAAEAGPVVGPFSCRSGSGRPKIAPAAFWRHAIFVWAAPISTGAPRARRVFALAAGGFGCPQVRPTFRRRIVVVEADADADGVVDDVRDAALLPAELEVADLDVPAAVSTFFASKPPWCQASRPVRCLALQLLAGGAFTLARTHPPVLPQPWTIILTGVTAVALAGRLLGNWAGESKRWFGDLLLPLAGFLHPSPPPPPSPYDRAAAVVVIPVAAWWYLFLFLVPIAATRGGSGT